MALLKVICWALIFIIRIRFPPGKSLAIIWVMYSAIQKEVWNKPAIKKSRLQIQTTCTKFEFDQ